MNKMMPWRLCLFSLLATIFALGCTTTTEDSVPLVGEDGTIQAGEESSAHAADDKIGSSVFDGLDVTPAEEECCTEVGKKDECWREDAIADGVTCTSSNLSNCQAGQTCHASGLCTCDDDGDCNDGVCMTNPDTGAKLCGPSYCNGFLRCDCWGGCAWWHTDDTLTPAQDANNLGLYCCEGTYPLGGDTLITFYSPDANCNDGSSTPCTDNADCTDGNECTIDTCNVGTGECSNVVNAGAACTSDPHAGEECFGTGTCDGSGLCQSNPEPATTTCGNDNSGDECMEQDYCDGLGNCDTDGNPSPVTTTCGDAHTGDDCLDQDYCDGAGNCDTDQNFSSDTDTCAFDSHNGDVCWGIGTCDGAGNCTSNPLSDTDTCGSTNAGVDCLNQDVCDGSGNCVNDYVAVGTTCNDIDTDMYSPICYEGLCGDIIDDTDTYSFGSANGVCEAAILAAPLNDTCDQLLSGGNLDVTNIGYLGSFSNTDTNTLTLSYTGTTICATNDYEAGGDHCTEAAGTRPLGQNSKDLVFAFEYETNADTQNDLYAFIIRMESDFTSTLYTTIDSCPSGSSVNSNRCISQHKGNGTTPYRWEYRINNDGNNWTGANQQCSTTAGSGYWWCERDYPDGCTGAGCSGTWEYPADPVPCEDNLSGTKTCTTTTSFPTYQMSQAVVYPIGDNSESTHQVFIFVDGSGASSSPTEGNFTLSVERRVWQNGPCERINDDVRVYDVTDVESGGSVYQGNLEDVVNSDHEKIADQACGSFDCAGAWTGVTSAHEGSATANQFWPNAARFKIHRQTGTGSQQYCVRTDDSVTGGSTSVIEVRQMDDGLDICGSTYTQVDAELGETGITFTAAEDTLYEILVSEYAERDTPCLAGDNDCNYQLIVETGTCPTSTTITTNCEADPIIPNPCTAMGAAMNPAGEIIISEGESGPEYGDGIITAECASTYNSASFWAGMDGPDMVWLIKNESSSPKLVTVEYWDHLTCGSVFTGAWDPYSMVYTCNGAIVDWEARFAGSGHNIPPDTCNPGTTGKTDHTFAIPSGETYQFIGTAWALVPADHDGDPGTAAVGVGNYGMMVDWVDTDLDTDTSPCDVGGVELPAGSGVCWYEGGAGESCDSVCFGLGGCDLTNLAWGTASPTSGNCSDIWAALDPSHSYAVGTTVNIGTGTGCGVWSGATIMRDDPAAVTCGGSHVSFARVCACGSSVDTDTGTDTDTGVDTTPSCPAYVEGGPYSEGDVVENGGTYYKCKPWPFDGWCNGAAWAYEPGVGSSWSSAWDVSTTCP